MATGTLGQAALAAATNTTVYTVPSATTATFSLSVTNPNASVAVIRVAIAASGTPAQSEYIEYDVALGAGDVLERTGLVASGDKNIVAYSSQANVTVNVYGYEA
jgi:hypothetical protein